MTLKQVHILQIGPYGVPDSEEEMARTFTVHRLWDTEDTDKFYKETRPLMHVIAGRPYPWKQDSAFLANFPALEISTVFCAGYDSVDMPTALARGIMVTNTPGTATEETADAAMGLLLAVGRDFRKADKFIRGGQWSTGRYPPTPSLHGRTVGILGLGRIGGRPSPPVAGLFWPQDRLSRSHQAVRGALCLLFFSAGHGAGCERAHDRRTW